MRVHFACSPSNQYVKMLSEESVKNVLFSYHFIKDPEKLYKMFDGWEPENVILDSGAFSVWSNNGYIDIDKYAQFCTEFRRIVPSHIRVYVVNLDVLPGKFGICPTQAQREDSAKRGWENMLYLESKGLKVIHVYHQHEDIKWLEMMRNHMDYIGISPANDVGMGEKLEFLRETFLHIKDTIRTHGFAVTSDKQLYQFPFFSVDSSSWTAPARFGRIPIFRDDYTMGTVSYKDEKGVKANWDYLSSVGIDKMNSDDYTHRVKMGIRCYQKLEKVATRLWDNRGIKYKQD